MGDIKTKPHQKVTNDRHKQYENTTPFYEISESHQKFMTENQFQQI